MQELLNKMKMNIRSGVNGDDEVLVASNYTTIIKASRNLSNTQFQTMNNENNITILNGRRILINGASNEQSASSVPSNTTKNHHHHIRRNNNPLANEFLNSFKINSTPI